MATRGRTCPVRALAVLSMFVALAAVGCGTNDAPHADAAAADAASHQPPSTLDAGEYYFPCLAPHVTTHAATFTAVYHEIFCTSGCVNLYCHGSRSAAGGMNLETLETAYQSLVGAPAGTMPPAEGGRGCVDSKLLRVDPGHPERSLIYLKVSATPPPCGMSMPPEGNGLPSLDATKLEQLRAWIEAGAKDDRVANGQDAGS